MLHVHRKISMFSMSGLNISFSVEGGPARKTPPPPLQAVAKPTPSGTCPQTLEQWKIDRATHHAMRHLLYMLSTGNGPPACYWPQVNSATSCVNSPLRVPQTTHGDSVHIKIYYYFTWLYSKLWAIVDGFVLLAISIIIWILSFNDTKDMVIIRSLR